MMRYPGEVYYLQPDLYEPEGKGDRPHVLLSPWRKETGTSTLAYGSSSGNDANHRAEHVFIDPRAGRYRGTGLVRPTYIYPSKLVLAAVDTLGPRAGRIIHEMPAIRASLVRSLGVGSGVTRERNGWGYNRRGRLVELTPDLEDEWEVSHALVVTEPHYSRAGYHQTVVPLLDGSFQIAEFDVPLQDTAWLSHLESRYRGAFIGVPMASTAYAPDHIVRFLGIVVPPEIMAEVDRSLVAYFGLQEYV